MQARFVSVQPLHDYPLVIDVAISEAAALANWYRRATFIGIGTVLAFDMLGIPTQNVEQTIPSPSHVRDSSC